MARRGRRGEPGWCTSPGGQGERVSGGDGCVCAVCRVLMWAVCQQRRVDSQLGDARPTRHRPAIHGSASFSPTAPHQGFVLYVMQCYSNGEGLSVGMERNLKLFLRSFDINCSFIHLDTTGSTPYVCP